VPSYRYNHGPAQYPVWLESGGRSNGRVLGCREMEAGVGKRDHLTLKRALRRVDHPAGELALATAPLSGPCHMEATARPRAADVPIWRAARLCRGAFGLSPFGAAPDRHVRGTDCA